MTEKKIVDDFYKRERQLMRLDRYTHVKADIIQSGSILLSLMYKDTVEMIESCVVSCETTFEIANEYLQSIRYLVSARHTIKDVLGLENLDEIPIAYISIKEDYIKRVNAFKDAKEKCQYYEIMISNNFKLSLEEEKYEK